MLWARRAAKVALEDAFVPTGSGFTLRRSASEAAAAAPGGPELGKGRAAGCEGDCLAGKAERAPRSAAWRFLSSEENLVRRSWTVVIGTCLRESSEQKKREWFVSLQANSEMSQPPQMMMCVCPWCEIRNISETCFMSCVKRHVITRHLGVRSSGCLHAQCE